MIRFSNSPASAKSGNLWHFSSCIGSGLVPKMSLTLDQVQRIAHLARIAVSPEEARDVAAQLNRVLGLIDQMQALDTAGIEPMAHPLDGKLPVRQRLRPDAVTEPDRREAFQQGVAPAVEGGLYLVPKVIE
jgi:aspartyl-tRNA(Asn)/glutamyl-tRNA(Gln) amidotransferase subunit C